MQRIGLLVLATFASAGSQSTSSPPLTCSTQVDPYFQCSTKAVVLIDATASLSRAKLDGVFNFLSDVVPNIDFLDGQLVSFMTYGAGTTYTNPMASSPSTACTQLQTQQTASQREGQNNVLLMTALASLQANYATYLEMGLLPVVLITSNNNQSDIDTSAAFVSSSLDNANFTVVNIGSGDFSKFPGLVFQVPEDPSRYPGLKRCVLQSLCTNSDNCDIYNVATTTAPSYVNSGKQCECNYGNVWVDIMFVFDNSPATGKQGLDDLWTRVQADMSYFTLLKGSSNSPAQHTRIGIIVYNTNTTVYAPLGSMNYDEMFDVIELPYPEGQTAVSNLDAFVHALQAAVKEFTGPSHRPNARKVIVVLTADYKPGTEHDASKIADTFKEDNGVLVVYEYIETHGASAPELYKLASPGYFSSNNMDSDGTFLRNTYCRANCFCQVNYASLHDFSDGTPAFGCFYPTPVTTNFMLGNRKCSLFFNGSIAVDQTLDKLQFMRGLFADPSAFYIGLTYDTRINQWVDTQGQTLTPDRYKNWGVGEPKYNTCAYVPIASGFNLKWAAVPDCRDLHYYVCENGPCDSNHYCQVNT